MSTLDTASPTSPGIGRPPTMRRPWYGWALHDGAVVAKRNLLQIPRVPELLFFSLVQPVIFVLLFAYVFGGAIPVPGGGSYREYLIPGVFGQTVAFAAAGVTDDPVAMREAGTWTWDAWGAMLDKLVAAGKTGAVLGCELRINVPIASDVERTSGKRVSPAPRSAAEKTTLRQSKAV